MLTAVLAAGQEPQPDERVVSRIEPATSRVVVDGRLDEGAWDHALVRELRYEVEPGENVPPPVRTEVLLTYDDHRLLAAFRAYDPRPEAIRARYTDRDQLWHDDWVGIALDTFNDERRAYEFLVNPLGVQMDAINDDIGGSYDTSWDAIWSSAGRITDDGYVVEMAIPFSQLRFPADSGPQTWGFDAFRSYPRVDRHHIGLWPRQRGSNTYLGQADKIVGFEGVRPGRQIQLAPTLTASRTDSRPDGRLDAPLEPGAVDTEVGVDLSWGITPDLTLSAALNPDFSQVEADAVRLAINQQFTLYFAEKRPFFLEGVDTFDTPFNLLYTRTIADPAAAVKLTGKRGRHTFGIFTASDEVTTLIAPGRESSTSAQLDLASTASVGRYRYDLGRGSTIGAMVTDRRGGGYSSTVASVDARVRLSTADTFTFNAATSATSYTSEMQTELGQADASVDGHAITARYDHQTRNWRAVTSYTELGDGFRADLGFMTQVGTRRGVARLERTWWGDETASWYNRIELGGDLDRTDTQDGDLLEREAEAWLRWEGALQSQVTVRGGARERVFRDVAFDQMFASIDLSSRPAADLRLGLDIDHGDWIDFEHVRPATRLEVEPELSYTLGRHLLVELSYLLSRLDVDDGRLFQAEVPELKIAWQHDVRTLVRLIVQYTDIHRNQALYSSPVDRRSRDLFGQLLLSYTINPQSVVYLGYSDTFESPNADPLVRSARTVFLKVGYAWLW